MLLPPSRRANILAVFFAAIMTLSLFTPVASASAVTTEQNSLNPGGLADVDPSDLSGNGSEPNPYEISNASE